MYLHEVYEHLGLTGTDAQMAEAYALLLDSGQKGVPVADELVGDEISSNGLCVWDRKKAFINNYKHKVSFRVISRVFENPPPPGCEIVNEEANTLGRQGNKVYVKISASKYVVITIENAGAEIRLVSAWKAVRKQAYSGLEIMEEPTSKSLQKALLRSYNDEGCLEGPFEDERVALFAEVWDTYVESMLSDEDGFFLLNIVLDLPDKDARDYLDEWRIEKGARRLNRLMRW